MSRWFGPTKVSTVLADMEQVKVSLANVRDFHAARVEDAKQQLEESSAEADRAARIHNKIAELLD